MAISLKLTIPVFFFLLLLCPKLTSVNVNSTSPFSDFLTPAGTLLPSQEHDTVCCRRRIDPRRRTHEVPYQESLFQFQEHDSVCCRRRIDPRWRTHEVPNHAGPTDFFFRTKLETNVFNQTPRSSSLETNLETTPGVLLKLLQHASDRSIKVTGEHRSALLQVLEIIPSFVTNDDSWRTKGFFLKVSDSLHSASVSVPDEDLDLIFSDKVQLSHLERRYPPYRVRQSVDGHGSFAASCVSSSRSSKTAGERSTAAALESSPTIWTAADLISEINDDHLQKLEISPPFFAPADASIQGWVSTSLFFKPILTNTEPEQLQFSAFQIWRFCSPDRLLMNVDLVSITCKACEGLQGFVAPLSPINNESMVTFPCFAQEGVAMSSMAEPTDSSLLANYFDRFYAGGFDEGVGPQSRLQFRSGELHSWNVHSC